MYASYGLGKMTFMKTQNKSDEKWGWKQKVTTYRNYDSGFYKVLWLFIYEDWEREIQVFYLSPSRSST
jgi:hypothetical protein